MTDTAAQSLSLALGVSALVTVICRRTRIPALLPLLLVGLALGVSGVHAIDASSLGSTLKAIITVAIGLLIFEGALHLNKEEMARAPRAVWGLLTIGAIVTWVGSALAARLVLGMSWPISLLLGSSLIVTGPTVVQPILRLVRVSPRLHTALAAEAVLVDPLGVVAAITTLEVLRFYVLVGPDADLAGVGLWGFAKPLLLGAGVGVLMGILGYALLRAIGRSGKPEPQLLNLAAIGVCMTCVGIGESVTPEAGLAAVTITGVIMSRAKVLGATELRAFKELLAVILVGTLFVLLASRFDLTQLQTLTWRDAVFLLVLLFAVRPVSVFLATIGSKLNVREKVFASTFAPRGIVALSVAAVSAAELRKFSNEAADAQPAHAVHAVHGAPEAPAPPPDLPAPTTPKELHEASSLAHEASRLELVMFVVIFGSVLLASTLSPALSWLLRVRAGEGRAVLIVGAHPLGIALAKWLAARKVEVRIVDSNEVRVGNARLGGIDAIAGNATDPRWMDDVAALHGTAWVFAWTGNHDVDQVAANWGIDRFGDGHALVWSSKPARGQLESDDVGGGEPITTAIDRIRDRKLELAGTSDPAGFELVLGWVKEGAFTPASPSRPIPLPAPGLEFVGLRPPPSPDAAPSRPAERATSSPPPPGSA